MYTVTFDGPKSISLREVPDPPPPEAYDALLRMRAAGICGSDLHYFRTGGIGDQVITYPWTPGHEGTAVVDSVGGRVTRVNPGDQVIFDPQIACGRCSQCLIGRPHTCLNGLFLGCPGQLPGCMEEYIVLPESCCFPVGTGTDLTTAVLIEPLSIALYAAKLVGETESGDIAILGAGPIGLCLLSVLQDLNPGPVLVTDKIENRVETARRMGASWAGNSNSTDTTQEIFKLMPEGLDIVFECCGDQEALDQAVTLLKPGGKLLIVGIPDPDSVSFDISSLRRKEITIKNIRRQNGMIPTAIQRFRSGKGDLDCLITHRFPMKKAGEAFTTAAGYHDGVVKTVIKIG